MDLATQALTALAEAPPEAPADEQPPTPPESEEVPPEGDEEEVEKEPGEDEDQELEPEAEPEPTQADDEHAIVLEDGETLSVADAKKRLVAVESRQKDYTQKTMKLAAARREFEAKAEEHEGQKEDLKAWFANNADPDLLDAQIREYWPQALDTLIERAVHARLSDSDLSEREQRLTHENREHKREHTAARLRAQREEAASAQDEKSERSKADEARFQAQQADYASWVPKALFDAGLQDEGATPDQQVLGMLASELKNMFPGEEWTEDHMVQAAQGVAKTVKRLTGKAPTAKPKPKPTPRKPPPSTRGTGRSVPATGKRKPKEGPVDMTDFFNTVRGG